MKIYNGWAFVKDFPKVEFGIFYVDESLKSRLLVKGEDNLGNIFRVVYGGKKYAHQIALLVSNSRNSEFEPRLYKVHETFPMKGSHPTKKELVNIVNKITELTGRSLPLIYWEKDETLMET